MTEKVGSRQRSGHQAPMLAASFCFLQSKLGGSDAILIGGLEHVLFSHILGILNNHPN